MSGIVTAMRKAPVNQTEVVMLTPQEAQKMLEMNKHNRPLLQSHVNRIAGQIREGKWKFNGDTIKISENEDILDGQHRLWAIFESGIAVPTVVVRGIKADAFATIDTIRRIRSGADVMALSDASPKSRAYTAAALKWLVQYQKSKGDLRMRGKAEYRPENSDILAAFEAHDHMPDAVEKVKHLRSLCAPSILAFAYYIAASRDAETADKMIEVLDSPGKTPMSHPFMILRDQFAKNKYTPNERVALMFKALNAVKSNKRVSVLRWVGQGKHAEEFPKLDI